MSENTKIEWATHTFNPWEGCQKVGPGCDNCYAENRNARFAGGVAVNWGPGAPRRRTSANNWQLPLKWEREAVATGVRPRVFCSSLADVFDNEVEPQWRTDLFDLILATPHIDWLLLTKRIGNAKKMLNDVAMSRGALLTANDQYRPPENVWLGATIVNREELLRDAEKLLRVPAAKHFWSVEPLLGDLGDIPAGLLPNWVICGGESGPGVRSMSPDWARNLRDQCVAAGVPFLFKQWGEWTPGENVERQRGTVDTAFLMYDGTWHIQPLNLATDGGYVDDEPDLYRVGKKEAGRHLDGRTWDEVPA